jgi:hypothetical protein
VVPDVLRGGPGASLAGHAEARLIKSQKAER